MFGFWDWAVVAVYIIGTTLVGHRLKGRQKSTRDFFLGGRSMPWYAVSASTIATTISAVTFIGVPALVYATDGSFVYLQLALGGIIARILVARFLVPLYYEKEFYSPYDYMTDRLGPVVGRITAGMFFLAESSVRESGYTQPRWFSLRALFPTSGGRWSLPESRPVNSWSLISQRIHESH